MFEHILLAVDGSDHSMRASQSAGEIARRFGSSIRLVVCYEPIPTYLGEPNLQQALNARLEHTARIIAPALIAIGEIPGRLIEDILEGPPAEAILKVLEVQEIDLVVMGTRGLSQFAAMLLGSQSQKVVTHAPCPVLLVR